MKRISVTPSARTDLLDIWRYIARDSADAADRVLEKIRAEFQKIATNPGIGHSRDELDPVYRVWSVYSYLIIYRPDTKPVQVIRVVAGQRDLRRIDV